MTYYVVLKVSPFPVHKTYCYKNLLKRAINLSDQVFETSILQITLLIGTFLLPVISIYIKLPSFSRLLNL